MYKRQDLNGNKKADANQKIKDMYQMNYHMSLAEKQAISLLNKINPNAKIGVVCSMQVIYPATSDPKDVQASYDAQDMLQHMFLDMSVFGRYPQRVVNYLNEKGLLPDVYKRQHIMNLLFSIYPKVRKNLKIAIDFLLPNQSSMTIQQPNVFDVL